MLRQSQGRLGHCCVDLPAEFAVKLVEPELQAICGQDQHVSLNTLVEALHESEEVKSHPLSKLLPASQLGPLSLNDFLCMHST